jgi:hypothetical protein
METRLNFGLIGEEEDTDRGEVVDTKEGSKLTKTRIIARL